MQNVVIAKPYQFVPPDRRSFWPAMFRPLFRPILARVWGVTTVEIVGIESLRVALRERASVLLVPNHCRRSDAMVVTVLGAQAGTPLYTMASWHVFMGRRHEAWLYVIPLTIGCMISGGLAKAGGYEKEHHTHGSPAGR